jgi:CubicO group peptidase (beta-lactamase class C family)
VRFADRKGHIALPEEQIAAVKKLLVSDKPVVMVCFGSPYLIAHFPEAKTSLAVFSTADVAQRAAARAIFGQVGIGGRIPVTVPGAACLGDGLDVTANPMRLAPAVLQANAKLAASYALLDRAVADGAFPGGALAVGYHGMLVAHAFGKQTYDEAAAAITPETIYDAASLTKPVVTATLVAMLDEASEIDVDAPVARYLPVWALGANADWRARVTVRHLLTHTSGLPPHRDYFRTLRKKPGVVAHVMAEPLGYEPGTQSVYSDLDFILLGQIVEELTGKQLDQLARERIFEPLGMTSSMFNPPKSLRARIAPTEEDKFRKRLLHGEVHDENAWAMEGVAGHAGLFSTAPNLAIFCQMLLNGGIYAHRRLLRRETIHKFTAVEPLSGNERTLGWMVPTEDSTSGKYFSPRSFGHLAFTGCSIWIDPEKELFVVLLTNRVHPTRDNNQMPRLRRGLHNAIVEGLGLAARSSS